MDKKDLFENENPSKALAVMALPTIASQMIILIYNLADTWFIGRTGNPYMIGASSLALTVYLASVALACDSNSKMMSILRLVDLEPLI